MIGENFDSGAVTRGAREEDSDSKFGNDNMEGASNNDHDGLEAKSSRIDKYHRHTPYQIQELEVSFKENPHPDEKARLELGSRLNLEHKKVKFWFQNRRTQLKAQLERYENAILKQDNDKLRIENIAIRQAMGSPICGNCGGQAVVGEVTMEEHHLRIQNARLRDEVNRISLLANKFLDRSVTSMESIRPMLANSGQEFVVKRNSFGGLSSMDCGLSMGLDFGYGDSSGLPVVASARPLIGVHRPDSASENKALFLPLAVAAMDELMKLAQVDNPLWLANPDGRGEVLNLEEYSRSFPSCIGMRPSNFISEATRARGTLTLGSVALVEAFMNINRYADLFPSIVGQAAVISVVSLGINGTLNGALQLMHGEFQVLSPLVPIRRVKFLRFCKQQAEGVWAVVDISVDTIREGTNTSENANCRRLPSGCIVQDMPSGYSKVIWIEHAEYDENAIHRFCRPLVRSGMGLGAEKWIATLQRQWECYTTIMCPSIPNREHAGITMSGRKSVMLLAQRMSKCFCAGVCATMHKWDTVRIGNGEDTRLLVRRSIDNPGDPPGIVLSASTTVWMPVSQKHLFDFLRNEHTRSQWDTLSPDGPMQQMLQISKGQDFGTNISLIRSSATLPNGNQSNTIILQETSTDSTGSLIVYAPVDIPAMNVVMNGGDSTCVEILPSGFSVVPDCFQDSAESNHIDGSKGSLLTIGFQILASNSPAAKLTMESVDTVNALISRTLQGIKDGLQYS
ncbi:hypothetical protein Leryth_009858 [Lithospermum erythrorhizon]|nr:hypothetical protein Leryth_009858 [Lithospermum erythrorhizon]